MRRFLFLGLQLTKKISSNWRWNRLNQNEVWQFKTMYGKTFFMREVSPRDYFVCPYLFPYVCMYVRLNVRYDI